jgi:antitoxin (DNA-binding transcriptional repressor) of toxin-antitoxin stability system
MKKIDLSEAKQKLSELEDRVERGEQIGIIRGGKLSAVIGPPTITSELERAFDGVEGIRRRARKPKGVSVKRLIEEGRATEPDATRPSSDPKI